MRTSACVIAAVAAFAAWGPASAQSETGGGVPSGRVISVNIQGNASNQSIHTSILNQAGSSGLVPVANANWNELGGGLNAGTGTIANLKDDTGAATSASFVSGLGNGWSITANIATSVSGVTQELLDARVARLGLMGDGFRDANADADVTEVTLTGIPYARYNVILYYATGRGGFPWAPAHVTPARGTGPHSSLPGPRTGGAAPPPHSPRRPTPPPPASLLSATTPTPSACSAWGASSRPGTATKWRSSPT